MLAEQRVLIVGGGPTGLSAAVFLGSRGVPTVLVERHAGSSPHPRALGWTPRTLEIFAAIGIGSQIPENNPQAAKPRRMNVSSLAGEWVEESLWTPGSASRGPKPVFSAHSSARLAQDELESKLRDKATALGVDIRMNTTLIEFTQDAAGLTATLSDPERASYQLDAAYLIAADGNRSPIRETLGIARSGRGRLQTMHSALYRSHMPHWLRARLDDARRDGIVQFAVQQPTVAGMLGEFPDGRGLMIFGDNVERDEPTTIAALRSAIGIDDLDIELIATGHWDVSALVADTFQHQRVFLAGDAAHTLPPNRGGYGANTGIDDAHNLAWKLAAVLQGQSTPNLLDTYDVERRPIAWLRLEQLFARPDHHYGETSDSPLIDDDAIEFGQLYRSTAVIGAGPELPPARLPSEWQGQPGTRAPHLWVEHEGSTVSTLDLLQHDWTVISEDPRWRDASDKAGIAMIEIGSDVTLKDDNAFQAAFGIDHDGAALIRPDGYIAWRAINAPDDISAALSSAYAAVASSSAR